MKRIHVKQYQVLINEETANCGVAINIEHYSKIEITDYDLQYSVIYNEKKIKIKNSEIEIVLHNCDKELLYYAFKTINFAIILGTPKWVTHQLIAVLK